jgi:ABC-type transport system involved in multi-copper enzyme maturation permease subunit
MRSIYFLALRQMSGRWRLLIMTVLAAMPMIMAVVTLRSSSAPSVDEFENIVFGGMLAGAIGPLIVLAIATAAFANEIEDRTLANLTLSPIPRWKIALPKLLATITLASPFIAISAFVTSEVAFLGDTSAAIGLGLLYIVLWEGFFSGYVSGVRLLSIRHHSIALMHAIDPRRFVGASHPGPIIVVAASILLFGGFLALTVRRLRRMDVP